MTRGTGCGLSVAVYMACAGAAAAVGAPALGVLGLLVAIIVPWLLVRRSRERAADATETARAVYLESMITAYGEEVARLMVIGDPFQGATREMTQIMFGVPEDVSTHVHKARTAETWKYGRLDARRFALRVEFEDGVCVGWQTA